MRSRSGLLLVLNAIALTVIYHVAVLHSGTQLSAADYDHLRRDQVAYESPPAATVTVQAERRPVRLPPSEPAYSLCEVCDVAPQLCDEVGADAVARAMAYTGTGNRLRRVLDKMRRGEPYTVALIGGSVSTGHGLFDEDELYTPRNHGKVVFRHLNALYPGKGSVDRSSATDGKNGYINGALGATGSNYFGFCFQNHIPKDVDLVLIELAINDERLLDAQVYYEQLIRGLLDLPHKPAIISVHVFALMFDQITGGGDLHLGINHYYDIPTISLRNAWLPKVMAKNGKTFLRDAFVLQPDDVDTDGIDLRHISPYGHKIVGGLVNAFIDTQICHMDRLERGGRGKELYPLDPMPRQLVTQPFGFDTTVAPLDPTCMSMMAPSSPLKPLRNNGWRQWAWEDKKYLIADAPGASVTFKLKTVLGTVRVYFQRSSKYGLGNAQCFIDGDRDRMAILEGWWELPFHIGQEQTVAQDLAPGEHTLTCEVMQGTNDPGGGREVRLIAVMSV